MVRLKDKASEPNASPRLFQFHYGTIKSRGKLPDNVNPFYFNSTMVRLKAEEAAKAAMEEANFNSTMVRLKESCPRLYLLQL